MEVVPKSGESALETEIKEQLKLYVKASYQDVPSDIYEALLSILCAGAVVAIAYYGWKQGWRKIAGLLLAEYIFLIYGITVIFRKFNEGVGHSFHPFWSYEAIRHGRVDLIAENVMNVVVFVPIGMVLGSLLRIKGSSASEAAKPSAWLISLMTGLIISGSIEALQYFLKRGFAEVDDVIHNTIGCIIGYILVYGSRLMIHGYGNR